MKNLPRFLALCVVMFAVTGCVTEVNGRKVKSTRWVNGRVVRDLESTAEERAALKQGVKEIKAVEKRAVIAPLTAEAATPAAAGTPSAATD